MTQATPPTSVRPELVEGPIDLAALKVELARVCAHLGKDLGAMRHIGLGDLQTCRAYFSQRVWQFAMPVSHSLEVMDIAPAYTLLRGMLEAYVRLEYLVQEREIAWHTLRVEAIDDEIRALKDPELTILNDKEKRIDELISCKSFSIERGGVPNHSLEKKLKALTRDDSTFGWMPVYRILCAKAHSRLTDMLRVEMSPDRGLRSQTEAWLMPDDEVEFLLKNSIGITQRTLQVLGQYGTEREAQR